MFNNEHKFCRMFAILTCSLAAWPRSLTRGPRLDRLLDVSLADKCIILREGTGKVCLIDCQIYYTMIGDISISSEKNL